MTRMIARPFIIISHLETFDTYNLNVRVNAGIFFNISPDILHIETLEWLSLYLVYLYSHL